MTRFVTPPVEVMTTTIATCGWSGITSIRRIVVVAIGGAETIIALASSQAFAQTIVFALAIVVLRFRPYEVELPRSARAYYEAMLELPAMQEWIGAAGRESETISAFDQYG